MIEKVNPSHPDKIADRIAGAIVDIAYAQEVLIGHGRCHVIIETDTEVSEDKIRAAIFRIAGKVEPDIQIVPQDRHLADNQKGTFRCGDNGIFRGVPLNVEQAMLSSIARELYEQFPTDGKYILDDERLIICQSNADRESILKQYPHAEVNPLGDWTGLAATWLIR